LPVIKGKVIVVCPLTGTKVNVEKKCDSCQEFEHISWQGTTPFIACRKAENKKEKNIVCKTRF
jgi:hypothetical protein